MGRSDNRARTLHGMMTMKKTLALAALLAATAFTPALAQEEPRHGHRMPTAEGAMPAPSQPNDQMSQHERGDRGARAEGARPQWNGGQGRAEGGWQRQQQVVPAPPAQVQQQVAPVTRSWNGGNTDGQRNWQGRPRPDGSVPARDDRSGQRQAPPVAIAPAQRESWQNREQRRDTWRGNRDGGGVTQRQEGRRPNGDNGWTGENRNGVQASDGRRTDRQWNGNGRNDTWRDNGRNDRRFDQRNQWQSQYRDWNRNWSRDWRRDQRYDWQRYRYSNRSLFQGNRYDAPYGWNYGYRRFSIGFNLSYLLYDQQYWIDDPYSYRLPPVYGPYRWVRYYDDVLLVDLRNGEVVDAIYDFFY